jgi:DMSO/TMAO reductase YedYZ heme-binding membrane subunit
MLMPARTQGIVLVSMFGFTALLSILFVLSIPLLFKLSRGRFTSYLMTHMRWIGIYAFVFALIHVLMALGLLFAWDIGKAMENQYRFFGGVTLLILTAMAATSNDTAVRDWAGTGSVFIALFTSSSCLSSCIPSTSAKYS